MNGQNIGNGMCTLHRGLHTEVFDTCDEKVPGAVWETYSAFANTDGGRMVIGVRETDLGPEVVGVQDADELRRSLMVKLDDRRIVSMNLITEADVSIADVDGRDVIMIDVPRADRKDRPIYIGGYRRNSYIRRDRTNSKCSPYELESMCRDSLSGATDRDAVQWMEVADLDWNSVASYRERLSVFNPTHLWLRLDDGEFLRAIGAAMMDGDVCRPTTAGLLMFGVDASISMLFPNFRMEYRECGFAGAEDRYTLNSRNDPTAWNILSFFSRVEGRISEVVGGIDIGSDEAAEVVADCVREMTLNALVNADLGNPGPVIVEWRRDRIEVSNPGRFRIPPSVAIDGGLSDPRNATVASMFSLIGCSRLMGGGIHRMVSSCTESGLAPPRLREDFENCRSVVSLATSATEDGLRAFIIDAMQRDPKVTLSRMAESLGVTRSVVERVVNELKDDGAVSREGGKRGSWVVSGNLKF